MYYLSHNASRARLREAQNARNNRAEIIKALSLGQITRRDLYKWGLLTFGGLALKNGLSPFAPSAFADGVPTGTPRSPLFGAQKFTQPMPRLALQTPQPLTRVTSTDPASAGDAAFPAATGETRPARRLSYHTDFTANPSDPQFRNPITGRGPIEGRPPGEVFAHQRWNEFFPKVGYVMTWGPAAPNTRFHPNFPAQLPNSVWTYSTGRNNSGGVNATGALPPFLIKGRYGEPILTRIYNNTPVNRAQNGGFGRNETQLHFHNAHNGAEMLTTAPRATAQPTPTTSLARSTITAGARHSRGATRSIPRGPIHAHRDPMATAVSSMWRAIGASFRAQCGPTTTASSSRPRTSTRAMSEWSTTIAAVTAAMRRSTTESICGCPAAHCWISVTSISMSTSSYPTLPLIKPASTFSTSSPPTGSWATCPLSTSPTPRSWRCCRASIASAS